MSVPGALETSNTMVLVVDMQEKLLTAMHEAEACTHAVRKLVEAAAVLQVPVVATEQYPAGLGATCAAVRTALADAPVHEKMRFSSCVEPVMQRLQQNNVKNVVVVGVETHVCVQQTVLDVLRTGLVPYVCADAVSSRRPLDRQIALERMGSAGAVVTTVESVIFELLGQAGTDAFKRILKIVK